MKLTEMIAEEVTNAFYAHEGEFPNQLEHKAAAAITDRLHECAKPLRWMQNGNHHAGGYGYVIRKIGSQFTLTVRNKHDQQFDALADAKAAAQAHYANQIIEGLNL